MKRGEVLGSAMQEGLKAYQKILNSKNEQELFCFALTHCDINKENDDGDFMIID